MLETRAAFSSLMGLMTDTTNLLCFLVIFMGLMEGFLLSSSVF